MQHLRWRRRYLLNGVGWGDLYKVVSRQGVSPLWWNLFKLHLGLDPKEFRGQLCLSRLVDDNRGDHI